VIVAIAQNFLDIPLVRWLALDTTHLTLATLWQPFTHVLVMSPREVFPLLVSLLFIWLILPPFEERYGAARVFQLALAGTLCSAALGLLVGVMLPRFSDPIAGPGPITLAAMSAYAVLLPPHAQINFFGVIPMQARQLLWVILGFSVLSFLVAPNAAGLASEVGAIGAGIAFVKWWMQRPPRRRTFTKKPGKGGKLHVVRGDEDPPRGGWLN
jgi:membrane associated rhomboid family serine protease